MMVSGLLDRETRDQYDLKLEVYDSQLRGNATVFILSVNRSLCSPHFVNRLSLVYLSAFSDFLPAFLTFSFCQSSLLTICYLGKLIPE